MNALTDFLTERKTGIGGSDIGAILGLSPWRTPYDVFLEKTSAEADRPESDALYWGNVLENIVALEYAHRSERRVQRINKQLRHPEHDFAIAHIDRAVINPEIAGRVFWKDNRLTTDRILECKTANGFSAAEWGEPGTDSVPETYVAQVQWYLGITGAEICDLAVLIGGNDFRIYTIQNDAELFNDMIDEAERFWNNLKKGIPPAPSNVNDATRLFPNHVAGKSIIVDVEVSNACDRLREINDKIKALEAEAEKEKTTILTAFGDAEEITCQGVKLATWKTQTSSRVDTKKLKELHPDIASELTKTTESRVFRLAKRK